MKISLLKSTGNFNGYDKRKFGAENNTATVEIIVKNVNICWNINLRISSSSSRT
jgi:hypothetical protein